MIKILTIFLCKGPLVCKGYRYKMRPSLLLGWSVCALHAFLFTARWHFLVGHEGNAGLGKTLLYSATWQVP